MTESDPNTECDLVLTRLIDVPREKMGFHEGWGKCADQLAALAAKL